MKLFYIFFFAIISFAGDLGQNGVIVFSSPVKDQPLSDPGIDLILSRLDLDRPGLEKVKACGTNSSEAITALLDYFRSRESVKHPVDRHKKTEMLGLCASREDLQEADNAMKHIFKGQNAYPPYFCGDDINWGMRPVPDNEWVWQLNRMGFWQSLALAYWDTGDEKYAKEWCSQLVDWTRKNPRDNDHNYAWRSIEAGIRGYTWTGLFQRFIDSPYFTPDVLIAFLNSCYDHASFLMTRYSKGSNWALMEAEGLAFIAYSFPEFKGSQKWKEEAISRLNNEIFNQVYPDGHQKELALGYHVGCIGWFTRTYDLARMNGEPDAFPDSYLKIIEKMCAVLMKLGLPDGSTTQFGDSWSGKPGQIYGNLKTWAGMFNRQDFLYLATMGKEGMPPDSTAYALRNSGFYSLRSSWDKNAICLVLKCGPDGGGHCQPDNGTFELYAGGRHLMPDAGSYIYSGDPENRAWFRQTKVHQTVTLDSANTKYNPRLIFWKPGKEMDILSVENSGYPHLNHRRTLFFVDKKYFLIVDDVYGASTGDVDLHFQLAPGKTTIDKGSFSVYTNFSDGWNVLVKSLEQPGMKLEEELGQVSFEYTKKEPRTAFRYRIQKDSIRNNIRFISVVLPYSGDVPDVKIKPSRKQDPGSSAIDLEIITNKKSKKISFVFPEQREL